MAPMVDPAFHEFGKVSARLPTRLWGRDSMVGAMAWGGGTLLGYEKI